MCPVRTRRLVAGAGDTYWRVGRERHLTAGFDFGFIMEDNELYKYGVIYRHYCKPTGMSYIGQVWGKPGETPKQAMMRRWKGHCENGSRCRKFREEIQKLGYSDDIWEHKIILFQKRAMGVDEN